MLLQKRLPLVSAGAMCSRMLRILHDMKAFEAPRLAAMEATCRFATIATLTFLTSEPQTSGSFLSGGSKGKPRKRCKKCSCISCGTRKSMEQQHVLSSALVLLCSQSLQATQTINVLHTAVLCTFSHHLARVLSESSLQSRTS